MNENEIHLASVDEVLKTTRSVRRKLDLERPVSDQTILEKISTQTAFYGSVLPAAWSLMLALRARGLGTTWTTLLSSRQAQIREIFNVPNDTTHTVMFPVAYTKDAILKPADRVPAGQVTFWDRWNNQT